MWRADGEFLEECFFESVNESVDFFHDFSNDPTILGDDEVFELDLWNISLGDWSILLLDEERIAIGKQNNGKKKQIEKKI